MEGKKIIHLPSCIRQGEKQMDNNVIEFKIVKHIGTIA